MRRLTLLLVVCAATVAQSALAQDPLAAIRAACAEDAQKFCAGVQPGGGRIVACLKEHADSLSDRCKQAAGLPVSPSHSSAPSAPSSPAKPAHHTVDGPSVPAAASKAKPAPAPKGTPLVILGERFVQRAVVDTQQGGMTAVTIHIPESWQFEGKIEWHYGWVAYPVNPSWHAENPANAEAYFQHESWQLVDMYVAPRWRQYVKQPKLGDRYPLGQIHMVPVPPLQAMAAFIKTIRGDVTNLKWLGQQDLPHLAKALRLPLHPTSTASP